MESAGARLRKLRLEKGISLEDVQKKTKIHLNILKSIEDDSWANLNPVYLKGFVKIYCKFLEVDPEEYLGGYKEKGSVIQSKNKEADEALFWGVGKKRFYLKPQLVLFFVSIIVLLFLSFGLVSLVKFISSKAAASRKSHPQLVLPKSKPPKKIKSPKVKAVVPTVPSEKKVEAMPEVSAGDNSESGVRIGIHALEDCWVQARLDGKVIFQDVLKKGRFEGWSAKDKVELVLGSAGGVRLEVNGKIIPSLGRKGQVLKNILITRDGLKVGK